jgi:outer membrane protein assembly factor BamB
LWNVILDTAPNLYERRKHGPRNGPCWHAGRLYAQSDLGRLYSLDPKTGATIWKADAPTTAQQEKVLAAYRQAGQVHGRKGNVKSLGDVPYPLTYMAALQVADGVVVADGHGGDRGDVGKLIALDAASGAPVTWEKSYGGVPLRCRLEGKEYLLIGSTLVEPRTGKALWSAPAASGVASIGGGYVVFSGAPIRAYTIHPRKAALVWEAKEYGGGSVTGVIHEGWYYGQVKFKQEAHPPGVAEFLVAHELATGKLGVKLEIRGVRQSLVTSLVATDGRLFGMAGAGNSGMWMAAMAGPQTRFVGLRMPTNRGAPPEGAGDRPKLDYCSEGTPAIVDGRTYWRGHDSLFCYDLRKP